MDLFNQSSSEFDYVADPVDTSFLQDFGDVRNITDLITTDFGNNSTAPAYNFDAYVNAKPSYQAKNQPLYYNPEGLTPERYSQSSYYNLKGFSPELGHENEYRYGEMQDWGDMLGNAVAGAYRLGAQTFVDGWKGWGRMASALRNLDPNKLVGSPEDLYQAHKEQEAIMNKYAIFATPESEQNIFTKQLLGDMIQQSGFSLGTTAQFLSEELLTMGLSSGFSLSKLGLGAVGKLGKTAYKTGELISDAKKLGDIWKTESIVSKIANGARRFVPLVGTVDDVAKAGKAGASVLQMASIGVGGIKRSLAELNMAMTEARMEAAGTYGELFNRMVTEHRQKNGQEPYGEELERIKESALNAAQSNFAVNTGILSVMNRIQFDNLFNKFGTERRIMKAFGDMADDVVKVTGKVGEKEATRVVKSGFKGLSQVAETFGKQKAAWEGTKQLGKGMFKWEASEGLQELLQEGSNKALQDYYYDLYSGQDASLSKSVGEGINAQMNKEGIKTFLMGALTGRLIAPITGGVNMAMNRLNTTEQQRTQRKADLETAISTINNFYSNPSVALNEAIANFKVQNKAAASMEEALKNHDEYYFNNSKDSALAKLVSSAMKTNMLESVLDTVKEYGNHLSVDQMKEAFPGVDPNEQNITNAKEYFNKVANEVEAFAKNWEQLNDAFGDMVMPELFPEGSEERKQAMIAKRAVQDSIEILATSKFRSQRAIERAQKVYSEVQNNSVIGNSSAAAFRIMGADDIMLQEIDLIEAELKALEAVEKKDGSTLQQIAAKKEELDALKRWKENWLPSPEAGQAALLNTPALKKAYTDYLSAKNKASKITQPVSTTDVENSWTSFMDYVNLNKDNQQFVDAYNTLANPTAFTEMVNKSKEAIAAVMQRLSEELKNKVNEAASDKKTSAITLTDKNGKEIKIDLVEGNRYLTESDPKRRLSPQGEEKVTYNRDVILVESIGDNSITVKINGAETSQTFTMDEFIERAGRLYDLNLMEPQVRMYYMNRDKEFTISVQKKNGKPHKVGGRYAKQDYKAAGVEVNARLQLVKEDGKQKLKIVYTNPVTGAKESMPYNPVYIGKYRTGIIDLTSYPELDKVLELDAEEARKENLQLQMEAIDELLSEQEELMNSTKSTIVVTHTEIDQIQKDLEDLIFVAEELEKLGKDQVKERNALKKLVNVKKIADIKTRIGELKLRVEELKAKRDQLEKELSLMEDLYLAYLEAQEDLATNQEPYEKGERDSIYAETQDRVNKLQSEKWLPEIPDNEFQERISDIQVEKDILDEQIAYLQSVISYLENLITNYSAYPDIMDVLRNPDNLLVNTAPEELPTGRGKVSPEQAATMFDVNEIRKGLVRIKTMENRKERPDKEKIQSIDYMLAGLAFDNERVLNENKLNAIDAVSIGQKIGSTKSRLESLMNQAKQLQYKINEYTGAKRQREELNEASTRLAFLKAIAESLAKRTARKIQDKRTSKLAAKARQKEAAIKEGGVILEQDHQSPTKKKTSFLKVGFMKTWGRHYIDDPDTLINTENGTDRFFRFSANVPVKGQNFVFQVVTEFNAADLGLAGIREPEYNKNDIKLVVMKAIKEMNGTTTYKYVGEDGRVLSDDEAKNPDNLVYSSMADMSKWDVSRVRDGKTFAVDERVTDEQIQQRIDEHIEYQEKLIERTKTEPVYLNVVNSTPGKQRVQRLANGELDRTDMENRIIEADPDYTQMRSATNPDMLVELRVSTATDKGSDILPGRVMMQEYFFDERGNKVRTEKIYRVFNRELSEDEKQNIYEVLQRFQPLFERKSSKVEALKLTDEEEAEFKMILNYLRGIIAWGQPEKGNEAVSDRFFWIDNGLHRGDQVIEFTESGLRVNKEELFEGVFHHVNHHELNQNNPYTTIKVVNGKAIADKKYETYTEYLIAKRDDGSVAPVYTSLPRVDSEHPQRTNVNLIWKDPADEVEKDLNVTEKKSKGMDFRALDVMVDEFINGDRPYLYVFGVAFRIEKRPGGFNVVTTKDTKDGEKKRDMFEQPFPSLKIFEKPDNRKKFYDGITAALNGGYKYGAKSFAEQFGNKRFNNAAPKTSSTPKLNTAPQTAPGAPRQSLIQVAQAVMSGKKLDVREQIIYSANKVAVDDIIAQVQAGQNTQSSTSTINGANKLVDLKAKIANTKNLTSIMDEVFSILDEKEYEKFQNSLSEATIQKDITSLINENMSEEEVMNVFSRYLLTKFIDSKLGTKPAANGVSRQPIITSSPSALPLDIKSAVAAAKLEDNKLSGTVYAVNDKGESKILYSATVDVYNNNVDAARVSLEDKLMLQVDNDMEDFRVAFKTPEETEDFVKLGEWMKKNLPGVPVNTMSHLIAGKAWGQFKNGAIYLYEKAEIGTGYHEAFEAVWNSFLTKAQQDDLANEFRGRSGQFTNPFTRETKNYAEASDYDVKEMLAEEFRSFVLSQGQKAPVTQKVKSFFQKLLDFIQKLLGLSKKQDAELSGYINNIFNDINSGKFAAIKPIRERASELAEYRAVGPFSQQETSDLVEGLTFYFFNKIYQTGGNIDSLLGDLTKDESSQLFNNLFDEALERVVGNARIKDLNYEASIRSVKDNLKSEFKNYISRFGLNFDEDSFAKEDIATDTLGIKDAMTIDPRKASKVNVKLLLASLPMYDIIDGQTKVHKNSMLQPKLVDYDRTLVLLLNELGNTVVKYNQDGSQVSALEQMMDKLDKLYFHNGQYRNGYTWIKQLKSRLKFGEDELSEDDVRMQIGFITSFTNVRVSPEKLVFGDAGNNYSFNPLENKNTDRIKDSWSNNVKDSLTGVKTIWTVGNNGMIEVDREAPKYLGLRNILNTSGSMNLTKSLEVLDLFGITFSYDEEFLKPYTANIIEDTKAILRLTLDGKINNAFELFNGDIVAGRINSLLNLEAGFSGEENILSYNNASGMAKYAVSIPSLFSNTINTLNTVNNLTELVQTMPWVGFIDENGNPVLYSYQSDSNVLKPDGILFDKNGKKRPGVKVSYHDISGVGTDEGSGVDTADLQFPDRVANKVHYLLRNVVFSNINSDKGSEFGIGFTKGRDVIPALVDSTDVNNFLYQDTGSEKIMNFYLNQLLSELQTVVDHHNYPNQIEVYRNDVYKLGHFEDVLAPSGLLGKYQKLFKEGKKVPTATATKFLRDNETVIKAEIQKYLNKRVEETAQFLLDLDLFTRIPDSQDYISEGIANDGQHSLRSVLKIKGQEITKGDETRFYFTSNDIKVLAGYLAFNEELMIAEQHKLIYGHPSMYKDLPKRANGPTASKEEMVQDTHIVRWMDDNMARLDGKERLADGEHQTMRVITYKDQSVISQHYQDIAEGLYEMLKTTLNDEKDAEAKIGAQFDKNGKLTKFIYDKKGKHTGFIKNYIDLNEADAMAWGLPDMVRDILFLAGKLSKEQAAQWEYEIAYEKLVRSGNISRKDGRTVKVGDPEYRKVSKQELAKAQEVYAKGDPGHVFQVLKTQYFGYEKNYEVKDQVSNGLLSHPVFLKHSVQPKFFRHVEGTQFEMIYLAAQNKQVDVIGFESGEKVGNVTDEKGEVTPLYNEQGKPNLNGIELPANLPIQNLYSRFFGIQVATADYAKNKVVRGTQVTKIVMVNFMENGIANDPEISNLVREYNDTLERMIRLGKESLLKELGLEYENGGYKAKDLSKLVTLLRKEAVSRDLPDNMIDAINAIKTADGSELEYAFDTLINATKIDNILNSIVDSRVISEKMNGKAAIQVSSALYESNPREYMVLRDGVYVNVADATAINPLTAEEQRTVRMISSDLKSYYRKDGKISKMEVYINWPFEDITPEKLGLKLVNGVYRIPEGGIKGLDNRLLEAIGFRIPTQSMNSIESIVIKGFVPATNGDMVVVPSDLVGKAGSDFDIDKLNIYLPNYTVQNNLIGGEEFYKFMRERLLFQYSDQIVEGILKMDKVAFKRINKATFTDLGKEYLEADESLEDLAVENGGNYDESYKMLDTIKRVIQEFNRTTKGTFIEFVEEDDTTKKGLQNKFMRIMGEMITHPSNFRQLVTPNNVDTLKGLAEDINILKVQAGTVVKNNEKSRAYLRSFMGNSRIRERYLTAKRMVGISAIHTTFHAMAQVSGIKLSSSYDLTLGGKYLVSNPEDNFRPNTIKLKEHDPNSDGTVNVGWISDVDGVPIADSFSEGTSGFVDGAKDPFVFDLNLSMDTAGTWFYLKHRGVSDRDVAYFISQPILDEYFALQAKNKSMFKKANGRNKFNEELYLDAMRPYYKKVTGKDLKVMIENAEGFEQYQVKKGIIADLEDIADRTKAYTFSDMKAQIEKGKNADAAYQIAVLNDYLKYNVQARQLGGYIQAISYDNKKTKTLYENQMQVANWERSEKTGFIANPEAILNNTFIGELKKQKEDLSTLFKDFFISLHPDVLPVFEPLEDFISDAEYISSKADTVNLLNRYQNFVIAYMLHTTPYSGKDGSTKRINQVYEELVLGADSLAQQLMTYKLSPDPRISRNLIIKELLPLLNDTAGKPDNIRLLRSRLDTMKVNRVIEEVNNLRSHAIQSADKNLEKFVDNLAVFSILQSGVQASSLDFKKVLPTQVYSELVKGILESFKANPGLDVRDVWKKFHQNNVTNRTIVPKVPSYVKVEYNSFKISSTSTMSRYEFMVKYIPKPGFTKKEAIKLGPAGFMPRLFQRMMLDSKGKWIYQPINSMGDGRRFLEIYNDDRDSIIKENNVKQKVTPGTVSADGFISLTPEEIANLGATQNKFAEKPASVSLSKLLNSGGGSEFDKLPSKSVKKTMTYAGIGSRQTPANILAEMTEVASYLERKEGYTLNTGVTFNGKKEGADEAFYKGVGLLYNLFSPEEQGSRKREQAIAKEVHPNPSALKSGALQLMARNTNQIFGDNLDTPVDFVLFYAEEVPGSIRPKGGTGQAVEMARRKGIPTINMADANWRDQLKAVLNAKPKINIYAGTGENPQLSNFATRPFVLEEGDISFSMGDTFKREFNSVEQAYQYLKSVVAGDPFKNSTAVTAKIAKETSGAKLKTLGRSLDTTKEGLEEWDRMSETFMYELLLASFKQNPDALQKLLATGDATLTHTQDKGKWKTEFPRLLMKVRDELSKQNISEVTSVNKLAENLKAAARDRSVSLTSAEIAAILQKKEDESKNCNS